MDGSMIGAFVAVAIIVVASITMITRSRSGRPPGSNRDGGSSDSGMPFTSDGGHHHSGGDGGDFGSGDSGGGDGGGGGGD